MINKIIIAIDGHSSTGKSTLAKMLSNLMYGQILARCIVNNIHALRNNDN